MVFGDQTKRVVSIIVSFYISIVSIAQPKTINQRSCTKQMIHFLTYPANFKLQQILNKLHLSNFNIQIQFGDIQFFSQNDKWFNNHFAASYSYFT
jgi:hypothetical protein